MAHALVWADFSPAQVQQLEKNAYSPEGKKLLAEYLRLTDIEANPHTRILLSLYHSALLFAKKNFTTLEKIATTISIIKLVHYHNIAEPFVDVEKSLGFFKKLLVEHSVQRPPYSIQIFTIDEVHRLTDYMIETYYRHFKLYKYAFTKKQLLDIKLKEVVIDTAPTIPPLSTATKLDPLAMAQGVDGENGTEAGVDGENLDVRALQSGAISKLSMRSGSPTGIDERVYSATPDALHSAAPVAAVTLPSRELNEVEQVAVTAVQERLESLKLEIANQIKESEKNLSEKILDIESRLDGKRPRSAKPKPVKK